jgi:hypothetical protein
LPSPKAAAGGLRVTWGGVDYSDSRSVSDSQELRLESRTEQFYPHPPSSQSLCVCRGLGRQGEGLWAKKKKKKKVYWKKP